MLEHWLAYVPTLSRQDGQDLAEYALLTAMMAIAVMIALIATGTQVEGLYDDICRALADLV